MLYFAYAADLWAATVTDWSRDRDGSTLRVVRRGPAVLPNHRLSFPTYNPLWGGGEAAAVPSPGKQVAGLMLELSDAALRAVERRARRGRSDDGHDAPRLSRVLVEPYAGGRPVEAWAYRSAEDPSAAHVPPAEEYVDRIAAAAAGAGLSMLWVMQWMSFKPSRAAAPNPATSASSAASRAGSPSTPADPPLIRPALAAPARRARRAVRTRPAFAAGAAPLLAYAG